MSKFIPLHWAKKFRELTKKYNKPYVNKELVYDLFLEFCDKEEKEFNERMK